MFAQPGGRGGRGLWLRRVAGARRPVVRVLSGASCAVPWLVQAAGVPCITTAGIYPGVSNVMVSC